jgi:crossover junction endodeoxyribonuclease RuvC
MKTILGIDPGLASTGYGLVQVKGGRSLYLAHGVIVTAAGTGIALRLAELHRQIMLILDQYQPDEACIEDIYFSKNSKSFVAVAEAKGVMLLALAQRSIRVDEYSPLEIKRAVAGNGRAEKAQVQELVRIILNLKEAPSPDHAADALAVAICHSHQSHLKKIIEQAGSKNV